MNCTKIDPNMGLSQIASGQSIHVNATKYKETKFGKCQIGSFLTYKVALSESNFETSASINCKPRLDEINNQPITYPQFPLRSTEEDDRKLLQILQLKEDEINDIEKNTRKQADCEQ